MSIGSVISSVIDEGGYGDQITNLLECDSPVPEPADEELCFAAGPSLDSAVTLRKVALSDSQSTESTQSNQSDGGGIEFLLFGRACRMTAERFPERAERLRDALLRECICLYMFIHGGQRMQREQESARGALGQVVAALSTIKGGAAAAKPRLDYLDKLLSKVSEVWERINCETISYTTLHEAGLVLHQQRLNFFAHLRRCGTYYINKVRQDDSVRGLLPELPGMGFVSRALEYLPYAELVFKPIEVCFLAYLWIADVAGRRVDTACFDAAIADLERTDIPRLRPQPFAIWFVEVPAGVARERQRSFKERKEEVEQNWQNLKRRASLLNPQHSLDDLHSLMNDFFTRDTSVALREVKDLLSSLFGDLRSGRSSAPYLFLDALCSAAGVNPDCMKEIRDKDADPLRTVEVIKTLSARPGFGGQFIVGLLGWLLGMCGVASLRFLDCLLQQILRHGAEEKISEPYILQPLCEWLLAYLRDLITQPFRQVLDSFRGDLLKLQGRTWLSGKQLEEFLLTLASEKLEPACCAALGWAAEHVRRALENLRTQAEAKGVLTMEWFLGSLPFVVVTLARHLFFPLWPAFLHAVYEQVSPPMQQVLNLVSHQAQTARNALLMAVGMSQNARNAITDSLDGFSASSENDSEVRKIGKEVGSLEEQVKRYKRRRTSLEDAEEAEKGKAAKEAKEREEQAAGGADPPAPDFPKSERVRIAKAQPVDKNSIPPPVKIKEAPPCPQASA